MRLVVNKKDTARAFRHLDNLLAELSQTAFIAAQKAGSDYVELVKSGMGGTTTPSFVSAAGEGWSSLSEWWIKEKGNDKFWVQTWGIYLATKVQIIQKSLIFINIFAGINRRTDGEAFIRACRNEYGGIFADAINPGRPLFEPAKDYLSPVTASGRRLNSKQREYFITALRTAVRKAYSR